MQVILLYLTGTMLLAKNEKELETFIQTIRIYSQDIEIEFRTQKYAMHTRKKRKKRKKWKE